MRAFDRMPDPTPLELGLTTQADREITGAMREKVGQLPAIRNVRSTGATPTLTQQPTTGISYARLCERSQEYLGDYWRQCRAFYAGGARLLRDEQVMKSVFPAHNAEAPDVYKERCSRAFYIAYPGEIIDHLLAGFATDPIRLTADVDDKTGEELSLPDWWGEFSKDVSPPGGMKQPLGSFAVDCLREMFVTQSAWVLVDLPTRDPDAPPAASKLEEEQRGLLDPYLCLMPSENVVDWQVDEDSGELEWALCYWRSKRRDSLAASRSQITERWIYWTRTGWERYEATWDPATPPKADDTVLMTGVGTHTFGVVPLIRLQVPEGLYAMGKLESIAREHFNKRCAASWAEYKALFAVLYEFMAPEIQGAFTPNLPAISQAQMDPRRAVNQTRGQGYTQVRGSQDSAKYIGPDVAPFKEARESCAELMREMHRVMFSMALSANMDSAALQRSGESKSKDSDQIAAILAKVGEIIREGFDAVVALVNRVRGDDTDVHTTGGEKFDADSVADAISEATDLLNGVPLRSPTFLKRYLFRLYKLALGANVTSEDLEEIREELDTAITAEAMMTADTSPPAPTKKGPPGGDDAEPVDPDDADDETNQPPPPAKPTSRRLFST